jgi:transcriptional regulator with XRE-family HTH domain
MPSNSPDYTPQLRQLMRSRGISTFSALAQQAGVSEQQVLNLRRGGLRQMRVETLQGLGRALGVTIGELLSTFGESPADPAPIGPLDRASASPISSPLPAAPHPLEQEYQRLQTQLEQQRQVLWQEFQQASLQTLEPWLLQWSAAAYAAQHNPQLAAVKLVPLMRPIEQLLQQWDITAFATVGSEIPYDPQLHQLMGGTATAGELVRVRYAGYCQGERLLYRAKVGPLT